MNSAAVAYIRVSTAKQEASGLSLDDQHHTLREFCKNRGLEVIAEFREQESGTKGAEDRPKLKAAIEMCEETGARLVIVKLDRLFRSSYLTSKLQRSGVKFICCDMPDANELTINILAAIAQNTAENIRQNTRAGLRQIKRIIERDGCYVSRSGREITKLGNAESLAAGRRKGLEVRLKNLEDNPERKKVKRVATVLRERGMTLEGIAEEMNAIGLRTMRGNPWNASTVNKLIRVANNSKTEQSGN